ncbi:hypothetical protein HD806DRAFT_522327 [Xylariaceae sp. AK1471]|nr:hypothetical protein HD806DRAFT_522327 [Xylariaceae sp. AK1471]
MDSAFRGLVDRIIRYSKLNISLLRISNVTEDSFHVSLEARITKTGPASASITPMTVDLCGLSSHFGTVTLPVITTQAYGTDVVVTNQLVTILDKEALRAFIRNLIEDDSAVLSLRNGNTTISALGVGPRDICYEKDIEMPGMKGPVVTVQAATTIQMPSRLPGSPSTASFMTTSMTPLNNSPTTSSISSTAFPGSNGISIVFYVKNPSPLEISFGTCAFEIQTTEGKLLAELKGRLDIRRGYFEATLQGICDKERKENESPGARLVGKRCAGAGWCDETVKGINVPLDDVGKLFRALGIDDGAEESGKKSGGLASWTRRLTMR